MDLAFRERLFEALKLVTTHGSVPAASRASGIPVRTLRDRYTKAVEVGIGMGRDPAPDAPLPDDATQIRNRLYEQELQLRMLRMAAPTDEYVKSKIIGLTESLDQAKPPKWLVSAPKRAGLPGVPCLLWSDWHAGEVVFPNQIGGVNEFNMEVLEQRVHRLVEKTIYLLRHHVVNPEFPGIVVNLGGDMLSGDIHDELRQTNEQPTMVVMLKLFELLCAAFDLLVTEFGQVFVVAVPGNHGRLDRKPQAKQYNFTNFDWLLYQFLGKAFAGDKRLRFYVPDGPDALYTVYGHRYLLTHGNQFRGGDGMIGHFGPVLRGQKKKQSRNAEIGQEFDTLLHGHFHTYFPTQRIIGNGSLIGYNEYANMGNFSYEPPIQAMWLTHPEHGIIMHVPVYLERHHGAKNDQEWVRWAA